MKKRFGKKFWIFVWIIALLSVLFVSVSAVNAIRKNNAASPSVKKADNAFSASESEDEQRLNAQLYSAVHNRSRWLVDLMKTSGVGRAPDGGDARSVFDAARACGVIGDYTEEEMYLPLNRLFVARTTVRALHYRQRTAVRLMDVGARQKDLLTMAYYGYFLPDANGMIYPDRGIAAEEYEALLTELRRYRLLKGKRVLSFGDSIMYGTGNDGEGIADMIAEKYGMTASNYAVPGATMGLFDRAGHIRDQLADAVLNEERPDIILLNGGTNDMRYQTQFGSLSAGYDAAEVDEATFTGGFEKTMWELRLLWSDVPVVYIRVHNMDDGTDENERRYGERGLMIARKWGADTVDLYTDTDMNTEDAFICAYYTYFSPRSGNLPDSIHPNAAGYARFYLPLISEAVEKQFNKE